MDTLSCYEGILEVIDETGWNEEENGVENGFIIFSHKKRDNYRMIFAKWGDDNTNEPGCCVTIDEFEHPRAVYLHLELADEKHPDGALRNALEEFNTLYV